MGPLQMNMQVAMPMAMRMPAMNLHRLQMPMQSMQPMQQLCSTMSSMQPFGFPMSFVLITIGGSLDSNARMFCGMIDDRRGRGRTH